MVFRMMNSKFDSIKTQFSPRRCEVLCDNENMHTSLHTLPLVGTIDRCICQSKSQLGWFCPTRGHSAISGDMLGVTMWGECLMSFSGYRTGMQLNKYTEQLLTKNYLAVTIVPMIGTKLYGKVLISYCCRNIRE
jgi:hypothetical protein